MNEGRQLLGKPRQSDIPDDKLLSNLDAVYPEYQATLNILSASEHRIQFTTTVTSFYYTNVADSTQPCWCSTIDSGPLSGGTKYNW